MVASYLIKAVTLTRDYAIQVEFNVSEAQYLGGMGMGCNVDRNNPALLFLPR